MGLLLTVQSRKFFSQIKNGEDFSLLTGDFATHLKGNIMEKMRLVMQVDISWQSQATASNVFELVGAAGDNQITRASGSFIDDGFAVGDLVNIYDD